MNAGDLPGAVELPRKTAQARKAPQARKTAQAWKEAQAWKTALSRKILWRVVLTVTGGLRVGGIERLPAGPCVIVANHNSHADTAALIAALPARRRPAVAAAADYWFGGETAAGSRGLRGLLAGRRVRAVACEALCGAFPVRRGGGGSADLAAAARLLAQGRDVVVYPEGSRSRDGRIGEFRRGAARLAVLADVPVVPVGITGTRSLLPAAGAASGARHRTRGLPRRSLVKVRIGTPIRAASVVPAAVPPGTVVLAAVPGTVPPGTVPPAAVPPAAVVPGTVVPATVVPGTTAPGTTAPGTVPPGEVAPDTVAADVVAAVTFLARAQVAALVTG